MRPTFPSRGALVIFSPRGLSPWFNGFCATPNSREIRVEQKPLNHRRKVGGEIITRSDRDSDGCWRSDSPLKSARCAGVLANLDGCLSCSAVNSWSLPVSARLFVFFGLQG